MNDIKARVTKILQDHITIANLNEEQLAEKNLGDLGINSLNFVKLVVAFEEEFEIEFDGEELNYNGFRTLADIVSLIESKVG